MIEKRLKSIDILKGLAMIMVILVHFNQSFLSNVKFFEYGQMGCQIFFVVSGFGVACSFASRLRKTNSVLESTKSFYLTRLKFIVPAYYFMMIVVYIANTISLGVSSKALTFGYNRNPVSILCNALLIHGLVPSANNNVMPGGWYIGTAMIFYLLTPLLFSLFSKSKNKKWTCAYTSVISVGIMVALTFIFDDKEILLANNSFGYFHFLTQLPCFCLGILMYFELQEKDVSKKTAITYLIISCVITALSIWLFFTPFFGYTYMITASLVGLSTYYLLQAMIYFENKHEFSKAFNPLIEFGNKSLYIYLVHGFFAWTIAEGEQYVLSLFGLNGDTYLWFFIMLVVALVLSYFVGSLFQRIMKGLNNVLFNKGKNNS